MGCFASGGDDAVGKARGVVEVLAAAFGLSPREVPDDMGCTWTVLFRGDDEVFFRTSSSPFARGRSFSRGFAVDGDPSSRDSRASAERFLGNVSNGDVAVVAVAAATRVVEELGHVPGFSSLEELRMKLELGGCRVWTLPRTGESDFGRGKE